MNKFFTITAMSLGLGATTALAQTTDTVTPGVSDVEEYVIPSEWEGDIADAFFREPELGTLRDRDEMIDNWGDLSEEDQDTVRAYCSEMGDDHAGMDGDTDTASDTQTGQVGTGTDAGTTGTGTGTGTESTVATDTASADDPAAGVHQASLRQICDVVEEEDGSNDG